MKINRVRIETLAAVKLMNQKQLAEAAGVSRQGLNGALCRGTASVGMLLKLAEALNVEPQELIRKE